MNSQSSGFRPPERAWLRSSGERHDGVGGGGGASGGPTGGSLTSSMGIWWWPPWEMVTVRNGATSAYTNGTA
jgi:hypothetical protein